MQVDRNIFRAYDIRGIAMSDNPQLTEAVAELIGKAAGSYLVRHGHKNLAIGRDGRLTSPALQTAFIKGALSTGLNVANIGLSVSPMVYFATCLPEFDCGVNVTASHNPKEYNGFKITGKNAHSICGDELQIIFEMIEKSDFEIGAGQLKEVDVWPLYRDRLVKDIQIKPGLKIAADAGNGVAGKFLDDLFAAAGIERELLFTEVDGNFPNHEANPEDEENMQDLIKLVRSSGAVLGFGFDGDGDRVGIVDEKGRFYSADLILLQLSRDLLKRQPGAKVVFDVKCSKVIENDVESKGGVSIRSATGHSLIETKMRETGALLAGEISGHLFFAENYYGFDDAFLGALRVLQLVSDENKPFSELFSDVPMVVNTPEIKIACSDNRKFELVADLTKRFQEAGYDVLTVDGAFVSVDRDTWGAIRCSNTSPNLTLRFEGLTEVSMKEVVYLFIQFLQAYPELDLAKLQAIVDN